MCEDGSQEEEVVFPWCLALVPISAGTVSPPSVFRTDAIKEEEESEELEIPFITQLLQIPKDSVIYDIYCIPAPNCLTEKLQNLPNNAPIERIGRIVTTSEFVQSTYDQQIFFKHQRKEEDYALRPDWLNDLKNIHANTGSSFFEANIKSDNYVDFEKKRTS